MGKTRIKKRYIVLGLLLLSSFCGLPAIFIKDTPSSQPENKIANQETSQTNNTPTIEEKPKEETISVIKYNILHETNSARGDNKTTYYVLIDRVDLADNKFKDRIKALIDNIVKDKGASISIEILDNKATLDLFYKSHYATNTLGRILTIKELSDLALHLIATFDGNSNYLTYKNQIIFFGAAYNDNPKVGKYLETIEYNPR